MEIFPQLPRSITDSPHSTVESFPPYSPITMKESFPPSNQIKARTPHHQPCRSLPPCLLPEIIWSQLKREATGPTRPHCNLPSRAAIRSRTPPPPPTPPPTCSMFVCLPAPLLAPGADCNEHPTPTLEDSQILLPTQHRGDGSTVGMDSDRIVSNKTPTTGPRVRTRPKRASTRLANVMGINSSRVVRKRGIEYQTTYCFSEASPSCKLHAIESLFCASISKLYSNYLFPPIPCANNWYQIHSILLSIRTFQSLPSIGLVQDLVRSIERPSPECFRSQ
jgi:hypothetical protein